jgi:hypothetical protein
MAVAQPCRQQWQLRADVDAGAVPSQQRLHGEGVPQIVNARAWT